MPKFWFVVQVVNRLQKLRVTEKGTRHLDRHKSIHNFITKIYVILGCNYRCGSTPRSHVDHKLSGLGEHRQPLKVEQQRLLKLIQSLAVVLVFLVVNHGSKMNRATEPGITTN